MARQFLTWPAKELPLKTLLLILAGVWCVACGGGLELNLVGDGQLNNGGNAVVVRIYQLRSDENFKRSTMESFWQDDEKALGNDLIEKLELTLLPGEQKPLNLKLSKEANFIAAAADFFNPDRDQWRQVVSAASVKGNKSSIIVGSDRVSISN